MAKEIKFRMWTGRKMLYDIEQVYNCLIQQVAFYADVKWPIPYDHADNGAVFQQYTGLKDRNGKEIYEGDIVNGWLDLVDGEPKHKIDDFDFTNGIVEIGLDGVTTDVSDFTLSYYDFIEVIGNIYEQPELLKQCKTQ